MTAQTTPGGRTFIVLGDSSVVTTDRVATLADRLDSDPRIASVSIVAHPHPGQEFLRATAPAGCAVLAATDLVSLAGVIDGTAGPDAVCTWSHAASERGLWHDWWLTPAKDVEAATVFLEPAEVDADESFDLATSRHRALMSSHVDPDALTITVDGTWLGRHQTGAQVLTTAALEALAAHPRVSTIRLVGVSDLPDYAAHLRDSPAIHTASPDDAIAVGPSDVIWYPNQIDQRVDVSAARALGRRVIATYLDLIAYDIPRYHASTQAWVAYRTLQRRTALSVDGITTISADVANRLLEEVPRLAHDRVQPIPLGLDHITSGHSKPGSDIAEIQAAVGSRPFALVLGNDFQHKNRDFAIEVWERALVEGVTCDLVLAGLHVKSSSSRERERELLAQHTNLRGQAYVVGHVTPESREWLLANAAAVLYPSSAEGFGFVPYEAAALGTPSTFAAFGPLIEISGVASVPRDWSVDSFAMDLATLLRNPDAAQKRVDDLRAVIAQSTWRNFADQLIAFIDRIETMPPVEAALIGGSAADASALTSILSSRTWRATEPLRRIGARMRRS